MRGAQGLGLVEVAGEADLVAGFDAGGVVPGVGRVGKDFAAQKAFDAALLRAGGLVRCRADLCPARIRRRAVCRRAGRGRGRAGGRARGRGGGSCG